jgi:hypothetical protein
MKKTKRFVFGMMMAALWVAGPLAAQRPGRPGMGPGMNAVPARGEGPGLERLITLALERRDSLGITSEQVAGLEALRAEVERGNTALRERMEAARGDSAGDRRAARERMRGVVESTRAEREAQRERFEQLLSQEQRDLLRPMLRGGRAGPDGLRRPARGAGRRGAAIGARGFGPGFGPGLTPGGPVARAYREGLRDGLRAGARGGQPGPRLRPGR